jgi:hypothetical protein
MKGHSEPEHWTFPADGEEPPPSAARVSQTALEVIRNTYARTLASGGALVFGQGVITIPLSHVAELQREIESLKAGGPGPYRILKSESQAERFRHPKPLPPVEE